MVLCREKGNVLSRNSACWIHQGDLLSQITQLGNFVWFHHKHSFQKFGSRTLNQPVYVHIYLGVNCQLCLGNFVDCHED
jgi:hypothetical protein